MTSQDADRPGPVGTSRRSKITPEREREFFDAVLNQIRECGYDAVTMEGVAASTRCSKSTLYRQWRTKPQFVAAALRSNRQARFARIDTGTLAGDLREAARCAGEWSPKDATLLQALGHAVVQDRELAQALREALVDPRSPRCGRSSGVGSSAARSPRTTRRWSTSRRRSSGCCGSGPCWRAATPTRSTWCASSRPPCCRPSGWNETRAPPVKGTTGRRPETRRTVGTGAAPPGRVGHLLSGGVPHPAVVVRDGQTSCPLPPPFDTAMPSVISSRTVCP